MRDVSRTKDRASRLKRISPSEDADSGGSGRLRIFVVAAIAGVVEILSLVTLIDALGNQEVLVGLAAAAGIFIGFVALFWAHSRLQSDI